MRLAFLAAALLAAAPLAAQSAGGLPQHEPLNPIAASRSALLLVPYQPAFPRGWRVSVQADYGNAIDFQIKASSGDQFLLDAELMKTQIQVLRGVGSRAWIGAQAGVGGSYDGVADGFFEWYHRLISFEQPERDARPKNTFGYRLDLPDRTLIRERSGLYLDDLRLLAGVRHSSWLQSAVTVTLPTGTGPAGYTRGVPGVGYVATWRAQPAERVRFEGTAGAGFTPRHGDLGPYQRTTFATGSTGLRLRLWGGQSIFGYFFYHSPYYRNTGFPSLDRRELTGDFGWIMRSKSGREWRFGLGEDLAPGDPGIDLILKVGTSW